MEANIGKSIPCSHPVMRWLVEYSATLLTKYHVDLENKTGYFRLHGHTCKERLQEFGGTVMHFVPVKLRQKVDRRWEYGVFLGRSWNADQNFTGK